ncbi:MAG: hypothetical protein QOC66_958, partial [Pseudonocardiales bacterium]|nr:hypothetical protein [Pseudonocardiales bacterium]
MATDHFGDAVAATYDDSSDDRFAPEAIERTVAFLAEQVGTGAA